MVEVAICIIGFTIVFPTVINAMCIVIIIINSVIVIIITAANVTRIIYIGRLCNLLDYLYYLFFLC